MVVLIATAFADEPDVEVWGDAPDPGVAGARVTSIDPRTLPASADLATAAARAPGVVVRRLGGLGDPAEIGIRGAGARHTELWLDGVPLNPEGAEAVDVSDLPLAALARVDVLRGPTPTGAGVPALGGALWLVSRRDVVEQVDLAAGSFGTARATLVESVGGRVPALLVVDGLSTAGDFPWYDDRGTDFEPGDDRTVRRENNAAQRLSTLARLDLGPATLFHAATVREDGVPGFTSEPTSEATFGLHRELLGLAGRWDRGRTALTATSWALLRRETYRDPLGEVGLGVQDDRSELWSVGVAPGLQTALSRRWRGDLSLHLRQEGIRTTDVAADEVAPMRSRSVARVQVGAPFRSTGEAVWPTVLVLGVSSAERTRDAALLVLPRLGARAEVGPVAVSASGGWSGRPPDLVELYGDRGAQVGNPALRPERGRGVDAGVAVGGAARAEVVAFASDLRDLIVWIPTPQGVARPANVDRARILGLEGSAGIEGSRGGGTVALTALDARQVDPDPTYDGRRLPRVPGLEGVVAGHLAFGPVDLGADLSATSATYADPANFVAEAPRLLVGATGRWAPAPGWRLEVDVRNTLGTRTALVPRNPFGSDDTRVPRPLEDFGGYPLPGRSVTCAVRWSR
jgi:outer membrane receptor protein involved in Fe transport